MDAPVSILTTQTSRMERPSGRPADAASSGSGEFARMLTALAPGEAVPSDGAQDEPLACGEVPEVAGATGLADAQGAAAMPGGATQFRWGALLTGVRLSAQGGGAASVPAPVASPDVGAASAKEASSAPSSPATADAAASSTSLMQWMLQMQMVPAAPVVQPPGAAALGGGRLAGGGVSAADSALNKGSLDSDGKTSDTRVRGLPASMSPADRLFDPVSTGSARKPEAALPVMPASGGAGVSPSMAAPEQARTSASADAGRGLSADAVASGAAQAALAAQAASAVATASATDQGPPVVAPAQTWIQTPVTQPGFSDEVVVELVRRVGQAEQGTHEVVLHLNPAEMGPVSVSIELNGTTARVEFRASEATTRQHLEAALPGLAEALRDDGLSLQHGSVHEQPSGALSTEAGLSGGSAGSGSDPRQRGDPAFDGRSGLGERAPRSPVPAFAGAAPSAAEAGLLASAGPGPGRLGRLDLFA